MRDNAPGFSSLGDKEETKEQVEDAECTITPPLVSLGAWGVTMGGSNCPFNATSFFLMCPGTDKVYIKIKLHSSALI